MAKETLLPGPCRVTISVVSHGDAGKVALLLQSLRVFELDCRFQIILTDNLGNDLSELDCPRGSTIEVIRNEHPRGFSFNHNQAFRRSRADYFCILNPDVIFIQEIFDPLIESLELDKADVIAPLIVDSQGKAQDSYRLLPAPLDLVRRQMPGYRFTPIAASADGLVRPDWIAGIFMLFKSKAYRQLNGFDEKYFLYFEDVDFCSRARLAGLKLIVDTHLSIQHDAQRASRRSLTYLLWHLRSAIRFFSSRVYKQAARL